MRSVSCGNLISNEPLPHTSSKRGLYKACESRNATQAVSGKPISRVSTGGLWACSASGILSLYPVARESKKFPPKNRPCTWLYWSTGKNGEHGCRELDWLVQLRARGAFGVDRHVCVVRCTGSRRSRNGRGRLDSRGLAAGRGWCDGDWHLVHALHWDAGVHPADSRGLPFANRSAVTVCGHSRFGRCAGRGEPAENELVPSARRKCTDGCGDSEHALHRHCRRACTCHRRV